MSRTLSSVLLCELLLPPPAYIHSCWDGLFSCCAQEPNFHTIYLALLDKLGANKLGASLIATTHKYIRILLASARIKTHTSERSLLKNLGTWYAAFHSTLVFFAVTLFVVIWGKSTEQAVLAVQAWSIDTGSQPSTAAQRP